MSCAQIVSSYHIHVSVRFSGHWPGMFCAHRHMPGSFESLAATALASGAFALDVFVVGAFPLGALGLAPLRSGALTVPLAAAAFRSAARGPIPRHNTVSFPAA